MVPSIQDPITPLNPNLKAIVDIGSNGIRFSISSIDPVHARIFPCIYKDRAAISLFDAQHQYSLGDSDKSKKKKKNKRHNKDELLNSSQSGTFLPEFNDKQLQNLQHYEHSASNSGQHQPTTQSFPSSVDESKTETVSRVESAVTSAISTDTEDVPTQDTSDKTGHTFQDVDQSKLAAAEASARAAASEKSDIPQEIIHDVVFALLRFKFVCQDFGVLEENIKVVATEATREAPNSVEFRNAILDATGWTVALLSKSEEARCGAYGVASSFNAVQGLFMDLGGGSTQLSWISCVDGEFAMSDTPVSLPYGAAALTRRLLKAEDPQSGTSSEDIYEEIKVRLKDAANTIAVPEDMTKAALETGGFKLYVSGGGFRGLGNLLLARGETSFEDNTPLTNASTIGTNTPNSMTMPLNDINNEESVAYPLPIINGYGCTCEPLRRLVKETDPLNISANSIVSNADLTDENQVNSIKLRQLALTKGKKKLFRVSERRASQLPAVMMLVRAMLEALPPIRKVLFSQGGVREGVLFHDLPKEIRMEDPLIVASKPYRPPSYDRYFAILREAFPREITNNPYNIKIPPVITERLLEALVNTSFVHSSYPKELQSVCALKIASMGVITDTHGLSHEVRALLGLSLCQRWGGELPDRSIRDSMISILPTRKMAWWAFYCGHIMHVIGGVYPGGRIPNNFKFTDKDCEFSMEAFCFTPKEEDQMGKKKNREEFRLVIRASSTSPRTAAPMVRSRINNLEKKLKKLSKEFGSANSCKVHVDVEWI